MSWSLTKRRVAITSATTSLVVAALLGSSLGTIARATAAPKKTPHSRSNVVAYVPGQPLTITIEHPYYSADALVQYAEIQDALGGLVGYWLPTAVAASNAPVLGPTPGSVLSKKGQAVKGNRITVVFDTTKLYAVPPIVAPLPPWTATPSLGSGSILIIQTNVETDSAPQVPIELDTVNVPTV